METISIDDLGTNSWIETSKNAPAAFACKGLALYSFPPLLHATESNSGYVVAILINTSTYEQENCTGFNDNDNVPFVYENVTYQNVQEVPEAKRDLARICKFGTYPDLAIRYIKFGTRSDIIGTYAKYSTFPAIFITASWTIPASVNIGGAVIPGQIGALPDVGDFVSLLVHNLVPKFGYSLCGNVRGRTTETATTYNFDLGTSVEPDRSFCVTLQVSSRLVATGLVNRTPFQQCVLEGLSQIRDHLRARKRPIVKNNVVSYTDYVDAALSVEFMLPDNKKGLVESLNWLMRKGYQEIKLQPKMDGVRMGAFRCGNTIGMATRGNKVAAISQLFADEVMSIISKLEALTHVDGIVLDGELYLHHVPQGMYCHLNAKKGQPDVAYKGPLVSLELAKITGANNAFGNGGATDMRDRYLANVLEYHLFSFFSLNPSWKDPGAFARGVLLERCAPIDPINCDHWEGNENGWKHAGPKVYVTPFMPVNMTIESLTLGLDAYLCAHYEGAIIYTNSVYTCGRTSAILKLKPTEQEWFQIVGVQPEKSGEYANLVYAYNGNAYVASGYFNAQQKTSFYKNSQLFIGKWALIKYQKENQMTVANGGLRDPKILFIANIPGGAPIHIE